MKKIFLVVLALITVISASAFFIGCGGGSTVSAPEISNITADVDDVVSAVTFDLSVVKEVYMDNQKLGANDYTATSTSVLLKGSKYGEFGIGTHKMKIVFESGTSEFDLIVTDLKAPAYTFDNLGGKIEFGSNEDVVLPVISRNSAYQVYDA